MKRLNQKIKYTAISLLTASLIACGGGGSGVSTPQNGIQYTGKNSEAVLSTKTVNDFGVDTVKSAGSVQDANDSLGSSNSKAISKKALRIKSLMKSNLQSGSVSTNAVTPQDICQSGEMIVNSSNENTETGEFTASITFKNCDDGLGTVLNGTVIISGNVGRESLQFINFSFKDKIDYIVMSGTVEVIYSTSETTKLNMVVEDKIANEIVKFEDFVSVVTYDVNQWSELISGRLYESSIGYVTLKTIEPMVTLNTEIEPSSGVLQIIGASETAGKKAIIQITYQTGNTYLIEADLDGDGVFEINQNCNWSQDCNIIF
jgi:hypothetical protein